MSTGLTILRIQEGAAMYFDEQRYPGSGDGYLEGEKNALKKKNTRIYEYP